MKITLINPRNYTKMLEPLPPLGLMYLASFVRKHGFWDISILDLEVENKSPEELERIISESNVVGVTGFTSQFDDASRISGICKKKGVLSIIGGVHATALPVEVLEKSSFDIAVKSEGERIFLDILNACKDNKDFEKIEGICFRSNGKIVENKSREFITNLDELPYPAWDLVCLDKYEMKRNFFDGKYSIMLTSRGCPNFCTFCQSPVTWKSRVRFRSIENVFGEMKELNERYGFKSIFIEDDTFTLVKDRVKKLCDLIIKNNLKIQFACGTRPGTVDKELVELMKKAGWVRISIGAESGSEEMLRRIKKNYSLSDIKKSFEIVKSGGITTLAYMIIGLPGETLKSFWKSFKFARSLKADSYQWTILVPYPGTEIYNKGHVKILDNDYSKWIYWKPVIKVGKLNPPLLRMLLYIAQNGASKEHHKLGNLSCFAHIIFLHAPKDLVKNALIKILGNKNFEKFKKVIKK